MLCLKSMSRRKSRLKHCHDVMNSFGPTCFCLGVFAWECWQCKSAKRSGHSSSKRERERERESSNAFVASSCSLQLCVRCSLKWIRCGSSRSALPNSPALKLWSGLEALRTRMVSLSAAKRGLSMTWLGSALPSGSSRLAPH